MEVVKIEMGSHLNGRHTTVNTAAAVKGGGVDGALGCALGASVVGGQEEVCTCLRRRM